MAGAGAGVRKAGGWSLFTDVISPSNQTLNSRIWDGLRALPTSPLTGRLLSPYCLDTAAKLNRYWPGRAYYYTEAEHIRSAMCSGCHSEVQFYKTSDSSLFDS